jgi:hypothetical protein
MSKAPPAGNGTTIVTGRDGYADCATAGNAIANEKAKGMRCFKVACMVFSCLFFKKRV